MTSERELRSTVEQLGRVTSALNGIHRDVGATNPKLYVVMSEAYIDLIGDLQRDLERLLPSSLDQPSSAATPTFLPLPVAPPSNTVANT